MGIIVLIAVICAVFRQHSSAAFVANDSHLLKKDYLSSETTSELQMLYKRSHHSLVFRNAVKLLSFFCLFIYFVDRSKL